MRILLLYDWKRICPITLSDFIPAIVYSCDSITGAQPHGRAPELYCKENFANSVDK